MVKKKNGCYSGFPTFTGHFNQSGYCLDKPHPLWFYSLLTEHDSKMLKQLKRFSLESNQNESKTKLQTLWQGKLKTVNVGTGYVSSHSIQGFAFRIVDFDFFLTPEGYDILICYHCSSSIHILHDCLRIFAFQRDVSFHDVDARKICVACFIGDH